MKFLIALLFYANLTSAETLDLVSMHYNYPEQTASCGMLKHRELERQKVIRELKHADLLQANNLLLNKLFMPNETWRDLSAEVVVIAKMPEAMLQEASNIGEKKLYFSIEGPGFVWQSYAFQIPNEMRIEFDMDAKLIRFRYLTYFNVLCLEKPIQPTVEWFKADEATSQPNTWDRFYGM